MFTAFVFLIYSNYYISSFSSLLLVAITYCEVVLIDSYLLLLLRYFTLAYPESHLYR